ncbi:MAG TPA: hypothetical protein VGJ59_04245 [Jatrophihabitantaceae bacterium]|jgi:hypothetical protein
MQTGRSGVAPWLAGAVGLGVAVGTVLIAGPADASTTVTAQLALSGVVTASSPAGGSTVGIHPGDSVDFKPASVPTQGLNSHGLPLGDVLGGVLSSVTGYQVVLHLPSTFPGGQRDVKLGACSSQKDLKVSFPKTGTYGFTWSAYAVNLLCLTPGEGITLDGNAAKQHGIALNAQSQWIGKVVAAATPPPGGLSAQIPGVSAAPQVGGAQLPAVGVPGATLPTLPASLPSTGPGLPGSSSSGPAGTTSSPSPGIDYAPPGQSIEDQVVPKGYGPDIRGGGHVPDMLDSELLNGTGATAVPGAAAAEGVPVPTHSARPIDLAANRAPAGLVALLGIIAIVVLSLVTAMYARLYLIRRQAG